MNTFHYITWTCILKRKANWAEETGLRKEKCINNFERVKHLKTGQLSSHGKCKKGHCWEKWNWFELWAEYQISFLGLFLDLFSILKACSIDFTWKRTRSFPLQYFAFHINIYSQYSTLKNIHRWYNAVECPPNKLILNQCRQHHVILCWHLHRNWFFVLLTNSDTRYDPFSSKFA